MVVGLRFAVCDCGGVGMCFGQGRSKLFSGLKPNIKLRPFFFFF